MILLYLSLLDNDEDKSVFAELYSTYRAQMYYIAHLIVRNDADAEDVVHHVFLNIAEKYMSVINNIKNATDLRNYLLKSTKHTAINSTRTREKTNLSFDSIVENDPDTPMLLDDTFLETICTKFDYDRTLAAIESLDKIYYDVLYAHFVQELTVPQVAAQLSQSIPTTKKQLVRGKKILLDKLNITGE